MDEIDDLEDWTEQAAFHQNVGSRKDMRGAKTGENRGLRTLNGAPKWLRSLRAIRASDSRRRVKVSL